MSTILEFIKIFQSESNISLFTEVSCYWFAVILEKRFSGVIMYDPHQVHFATKIKGKIYDITGLVDSTDYIEWSKYVKESDDTDLIISNCIRLERR